MKNKILFALSAIGVLLGIYAAIHYGRKKPAQPPVFSPAPNPYAQGIYANGIVESYQTNGENINIYPEVSGRVTKILVSEGQPVHAGAPLLQLDDSIQRATTAQLKSQVEAAQALLEELKAEPRKEVLAVSFAQVQAARANLDNVRAQLQKVRTSYRLNPRSISKNDLDNAINSVRVAEKNLQVTLKQYELTKAGAWSFDIRNQEKQVNALTDQYASASALLAKYTLRAPVDGVVLSIKTATGSYISPQGVYGTYTEGYTPVLVMGGSEQYLQVRTFVDEILVPRLPPPDKIRGQMFIRGTRVRIPLQYVRTQPYVSPKIELSDQRQERVDVRVLPVIFKFRRPWNINIFPGQLVDVYIGRNQMAQLPGKSPEKPQRGAPPPPAKKAMHR